tara:strand:+ start:343 stop:678 length:336 start_codon:yes stop_codon:yes gene_type:complete
MKRYTSKPKGRRRFKHVIKTDAGHRYFTELSTGRIAIADQSGDFPDQTDDGVLFLTDKPAFARHFRDQVEYVLPLETESGEQTQTPVSEWELMLVNHLFFSIDPRYTGRAR